MTGFDSTVKDPFPGYIFLTDTPIQIFFLIFGVTQIRVCKIGPVTIGTGQIRILQNGPLKMGIIQIGDFQVGPHQTGSF